MHRIPPLLLAGACALSATPATAAEWTFSGSATVTSDYVFRGVSQTLEDPALQLGAKLAHASGFYGSVWGSNVDYGDAIGSDAEIDYVVGFSRAANDHWSYDVNLTRYTYPGTDDAFELDYNELIGTLTFRQNTWATVGWSNDVFASDEPGTWVQVGRKIPLGERFRFEIAGARYFLDDAAYADDYSHAQLSAVYAWQRFDLRASAHWTSSSTERLFGEVGDSRVEVAASVYF